MTGNADTICAVATPSGRGGISIIRISGPESRTIARQVLGFEPRPRHAHYGPFLSSAGETIDTGIALYFPAPDSFTGEDVVELQSHGGPFVVDMLLQEILLRGLRPARPGEFSERAFLNDKIDLTQAEAIADLIDSRSTEAARFAVRSMRGEFSRLINQLINSIIDLRKYVEASIDFPEEEVDFLGSGQVESSLHAILDQLDTVLSQAKQGTIMKEGLKVVIAGEPNAGKSSLLNVLAGESRAIVTDVAGTTRDTLREQISIDGMPLQVIDTAGLHVSDNIVEQEGIRRAWREIRDADLVLLIIDASGDFDFETSDLWREIIQATGDPEKIFRIYNKIDLTGHDPRLLTPEQTRHDPHGTTAIYLSAKQREGIGLLKTALRHRAGLSSSEEGGFIARRRHLDALIKSRDAVKAAQKQLATQKAGELVAEDLREAHRALEIITGSYTPDDLLGEIFSSFCIGK